MPTMRTWTGMPVAGLPMDGFGGKQTFPVSAVRFPLTAAGFICDPPSMDKLCFAAATTTTTATGGSSPGCMR
jgi:hypothetical protein